MKYLILIAVFFTSAAHADMLIIGDSTIKAAYQYVVAEMPCVDKADGNARDSGNALARLPEWLSGKDYSVIYFNVGLWDIARRLLNGPSIWTLDPTDQAPVTTERAQYKANLEAMVELIRTIQPNAVIIFATSTDVPENSSGRLPYDLKTYNLAAKQAMTFEGVEVDDRYAFMLPYAYLHKTDTPNKVHYLPAGYQVMASHIVDVLQAHGGC